MIDSRQRNTALILGMILWFCAAMVVHFLPQMFDGGIMSAVMFALAIPSGWLTMMLLRKLGSPTDTELIIMLGWGTLVALILDGIAISFFSGNLCR